MRYFLRSDQFISSIIQRNCNNEYFNLRGQYINTRDAILKSLGALLAINAIKFFLLANFIPEGDYINIGFFNVNKLINIKACY